MDYKGKSDEELALKYRNGDEGAIDFLFEKYKNIVRKKARAMYIAGGDNDDLIQEGMIGLFKAVRDYDASKEASFATFASMCINRQIITAVAASNRKKHAPLNGYVSFDAPAGGDENDMRVGDVLEAGREQNPERLLLDKEHADDLRNKMGEVLSPFELQVVNMYMEGNDYIQIAQKLDKTPKSIDNALQRIRNKMSKLNH